MSDSGCVSKSISLYKLTSLFAKKPMSERFGSKGEMKRFFPRAGNGKRGVPREDHNRLGARDDSGTGGENLAKSRAKVR
jgi:hypothetical protein